LLSFTHFPFFYREINPKPQRRKLLLAFVDTFFYFFIFLFLRRRLAAFRRRLFFLLLLLLLLLLLIFLLFVLLGQIERVWKDVHLSPCGVAVPIESTFYSVTNTRSTATRERRTPKKLPAAEEKKKKKKKKENNWARQSIRTGHASLRIVTVYKVISWWTSRLYRNCSYTRTGSFPFFFLCEFWRDWKIQSVTKLVSFVQEKIKIK
jgi:hypothetical protein